MPDTEIEVPTTMVVEDAPPAEAVEESAPEKSPNDIARDKIYAGRNAAIARELAYGEEMADNARETAQIANPDLPALTHDEHEPEAPVEAAPPEVIPPVAEPLAAPVAATPAPQIQQGQPERFPLDMGNGQQVWVTPAEFNHLARIGIAANQALQQQQRVPEPAPPPVNEDRARALVKAIAYGNEDDGVRALSEFMGAVAPQRPNIDPNQITNVAINQVYAKMRRDQDLATTAMEFPEVFGKPGEAMTKTQVRASQLATLELQTLFQTYQKQGIVKPDLDLYREAAGNVVADLGLRQAPQPGAGQQNSTALQAGSSKLEAKRAAPRIPMAAGRAASLGSEESRAPTGSELVNRMRQLRGQSSLQ